MIFGSVLNAAMSWRQ